MCLQRHSTGVACGNTQKLRGA